MCRTTWKPYRLTHSKDNELRSTARGDFQDLVGGNTLLDEIFRNAPQFGFSRHKFAQQVVGRFQ